MLVNGVAAPVVVTPQVARRSVLVTGAGATLRLAAAKPNGGRFPLADGTSIALPVTGSLDMFGTGLLPHSAVTLTLHSDPTPLASNTVNRKGALRSDSAIPRTVQFGAHWLQVEGTLSDGSQASFAVGLRVIAPHVQRPTKALTLPKTLNENGWTTLLKLPVRTNAKETAGVRARCIGRPGVVTRGETPRCQVETTSSELRVKLSGDIPTKVRISVRAPSVPGFTAYRMTKIIGPA